MVDHPLDRRAMLPGVAQPMAAQLLDRQLLSVSQSRHRQT